MKKRKNKKITKSNLVKLMRKHKTTIRKVLFFSIFIIALLLFVFLLSTNNNSPQKSAEQIGAEVIPSYTPTQTDCIKLDEKESTPRLISIEKININNNCLETINVASDGTLGDPQGDPWSNFGYWLNPPHNYVKFGVSIFTCHTSFNPEKSAVCDNLDQLVIDNNIVIELNSGQKKIYQIKDIKTVHFTEIDMDEFVTAVEIGKESLSIMTCTGFYDIQTDDASHRLLIRASLVD